MLRQYSEAEHPWAYGAAHLALGIFEQAAHDMVALGREKVPKIGGAVLVISHRDGYDPIAAGTAFPRPVYFMSKKELWEDDYSIRIPVLGKETTAGKVAEFFGAFPVDREHPGHSSLKRAIDLARAERVPGIFPEMSRYEDEALKIVRGQELGYLNPGAAMIACTANVPMLIMGLKVQREVNRKGKSRIARVASVIKDPFYPVRDPELPKTQAYEKIMHDLRPTMQAAHDEACELAV